MIDLEEELYEGMIRLASILKEEDLLTDPIIYNGLIQLVTVLEPQPQALPPEMIEQLKSIKNKAERFKTAAMATGSFNKELMDSLAESMEATGLFKGNK